MSQELETVVPESTALVLPNGMVIDTANILEVVEAVKDLNMLSAQIRAARSELTRLVLLESERQGTRSMRFGSVHVEVRNPLEIEWDMDRLADLRDAGLPEERWDALVTETVSTRVNAVVAKQIAGASERYASIIASARTDHEKNPSVSVK